MNKEMIEALAKSLHFSLSEGEIEDALMDFQWLETIQNEWKQLNTENVEPMFTCFEISDHELDQDLNEDTLLVQDVLKNARHTQDDSIQVPKVVRSE